VCTHKSKTHVGRKQVTSCNKQHKREKCGFGRRSLESSSAHTHNVPGYLPTQSVARVHEKARAKRPRRQKGKSKQMGRRGTTTGEGRGKINETSSLYVMDGSGG
jgi:hypothetical protein